MTDSELIVKQISARLPAISNPQEKAILQQQFDWGEEEFWQRQGELSDPVFTSEDAREGAVAFSEKRDPVWQGR